MLNQPGLNPADPSFRNGAPIPRNAGIDSTAPFAEDRHLSLAADEVVTIVSEVIVFVLSIVVVILISGTRLEMGAPVLSLLFFSSVL